MRVTPSSLPGGAAPSPQPSAGFLPIAEAAELTGIGTLPAVKTLTCEHREVLVQVYFRGAQVAKVAQVLGIAPGTVMSRAYYALRALRRILAGYAADLH